MAHESRAKRARTAANGSEGRDAHIRIEQRGGIVLERNEAAASTVAAAIAAGRSPLDALPDELLALGRVLFLAARRGWIRPPTCDETSLLDPKEDMPDVQPKQLVQLKAVCRRFRRVVDDGSLWGRVALREPNDAAVDPEALTKLPEQSRKALAAAFRDQLEELSITFSGADAAQLPVTGLASIQHMQRLRSLNVRSLSVLSLLPNLQMLDLGIPLPVTVLEALTPLAPSLRALRFRAAIGSGQPPAAVFAAAAKFTALETLWLSFFSADSGLMFSPSAHDEDHLRPLCSLTQIRDLAIAACARLGWIGFISHMPRLQSLIASIGNVNSSPGIDLAPLSAAPALRSLQNMRREPLRCSPAAAPSRSSTSSSRWKSTFLKPWAQLQHLGIKMHDGGSMITGSFLKRLASDVPGLRLLEVNSALPVATDLVSVSSLNGLV
eukprot:tig00000219_g19471.t1